MREGEGEESEGGVESMASPEDGADGESSPEDGGDGASRPEDMGDGASRPDGARPSRVREGRQGGGQNKGKFMFYSMRMDKTNIWFVPRLISSDNLKTLESFTTL